MTFQMFNREFNINRDGRMWMSSSGGVWETQIGDANVGRVWVKDRFGLGAVGVANYVLNCAGQARFTSAVQFIGTDSAISLNNGSYLNFANNGSIRRYTPDATEGLYMAHNNFVAVSVGDVSNSSNQYFMCDGAVSKTIFNKPVDVLGDVYTNGDLTMVSGKKIEVNQVQSVSGNTLLLQNSPSGNVQFGNTSKLIIDNADMYVDTNDLIIWNSNTSNSINLVVGLSATYADNKIILNSGSNSELRGDWTIDGAKVKNMSLLSNDSMRFERQDHRTYPKKTSHKTVRHGKPSTGVLHVANTQRGEKSNDKATMLPLEFDTLWLQLSLSWLGFVGVR